MIGHKHEGWMGRRKPWKEIVWKILHGRYEKETLCQQLYPADPEPNPTPPTTAGQEHMQQSTSSSSGLQQFVNQPSVGSAANAEPRNVVDPVEEDEVIPPPDEDTKANPDTSLSDMELERAMLRWTEMVEGVVLLNSIDCVSSGGAVPRITTTTTRVWNNHNMR